MKATAIQEKKTMQGRKTKKTTQKATKIPEKVIIPVRSVSAKQLALLEFSVHTPLFRFRKWMFAAEGGCRILLFFAESPGCYLFFHRGGEWMQVARGGRCQQLYIREIWGVSQTYSKLNLLYIRYSVCTTTENQNTRMASTTTLGIKSHTGHNADSHSMLYHSDR